MNALKNLTLKLDDTRTDDQHILELAAGLHHFDFLKSLTLSFSGNPLTLKGVSNVLTGVSKLPRLTLLHVNVRRVQSLAHQKAELNNLVSTLRVANLLVHH